MTKPISEEEISAQPRMQTRSTNQAGFFGAATGIQQNEQLRQAEQLCLDNKACARLGMLIFLGGAGMLVTGLAAPIVSQAKIALDIVGAVSAIGGALCVGGSSTRTEAPLLG